MSVVSNLELLFTAVLGRFLTTPKYSRHVSVVTSQRRIHQYSSSRCLNIQWHPWCTPTHSYYSPTLLLAQGKHLFDIFFLLRRRCGSLKNLNEIPSWGLAQLQCNKSSSQKAPCRWFLQTGSAMSSTTAGNTRNMLLVWCLLQTLPRE